MGLEPADNTCELLSITCRSEIGERTDRARVSRVLLFYRKDWRIATTIATNTTSRPTSTLASRDRIATGES
jgi:hypothetical protein